MTALSHSVRAAIVCAAIGGFVPPVVAQSVADRTPNLSGGWTAAPGVVQFNFVHRFEQSGPPLRKITNAPTFFVGSGLTHWAMAGFAYGPNSQLIANYPNEWEFFARARPLAERRGFPLDVSLQSGYNVASQTVDNELGLARSVGPLRLLGVGRVFWHPDSTRAALGGGGVLRLTRWLALAGDWTTLVDRRRGEQAAWGAGIQLGIPYTPHSFSVQVTNVNTGTLGGASRGTKTRVGFEYTVPITLARYAPRGSGNPTPHPTPMMEPPPVQGMTGDTVRIAIENLKYGDEEITVTAGTVVEWINRDPLAHSVTSPDRRFDSDLIEPGGRWTHRFGEPGTFDYTCTPHPFMHGRVIVRPASGG